MQRCWIRRAIFPRAIFGRLGMPEKHFPRPVRATKHCRHYSYDLGAKVEKQGPRCALEVDLSFPGSSQMSMPQGGLPRGLCSQREEYTDEERAAWAAFQTECSERVSAAADALPAPIPLNTQGETSCPNCGGVLHFARWHRGAAVSCETENCAEARFSIEAGADWPAPQKTEVSDV
ncbi:hypothetical protein RHWG_00043 [Rhodobacter phage RC1]|uniref:hypothetical protein n=2 Tax=unclassified Caudoviricetes TaxID=2788787 RepID=UPI0002C1873F|nr:hypothetical protein RHWG_00043 [Rhodobacter phage RC1]AGH58064.1 hypothetical protein RHWG_00043 [Rhodobacter phage RC1]